MLQILTLRGEVKTVVETSAPAYGRELIAESAHLPVQSQAFKIHVCGPQDGEAGRLIAASGFDADEAVLDNVDAANAVLAGQSIDSEEELERVGRGCSRRGEFGGDAGSKGDGEILGSGRRRFGVDGQFPHVIRGGGIGIFQDACFIGAVGEVLIHTPWLRLCRCDWDILLSGVIEEVVPANKTGVEFGKSPWRYDFDGGLERIEGEFKADLIVAFAGASMRYSDTILLLSDCNLRSGNDRSCKRGS